MMAEALSERLGVEVRTTCTALIDTLAGQQQWWLRIRKDDQIGDVMI
jgi:hypothetical protein